MIEESGQVNTSEARDELKVHLAARRDLPAHMEDELVEAFLAKLERAVDVRVESRLLQARGEAEARQLQQDRRAKQRIAVAAISLGLAVPLSAIAGGIAGMPGLILVWLVILLINMPEEITAWMRPR